MSAKNIMYIGPNTTPQKPRLSYRDQVLVNSVDYKLFDMMQRCVTCGQEIAETLGVEQPPEHALVLSAMRSYDGAIRRRMAELQAAEAAGKGEQK
jgi:hypothetical protein